MGETLETTYLIRNSRNLVAKGKAWIEKQTKGRDVSQWTTNKRQQINEKILAWTDPSGKRKLKASMRCHLVPVTIAI